MKVDIAIMTVREDEFTAVRKRFKTERQRIPGGRTYLIGEVKTEKQTYTIAIARCIDQANDASQRLAHQMIHDLDPRLILVVGIAGGVPRDEFTLGDVVVSTRIVNPDVDAWYADGTTDYATRGGPPHPLVEDIVSLLPDEPQLAGWTETIQLERPSLDPEQENITEDEEWREKVRQSLNWHFGEEQKRGRPPTFTIGHILSSNHLMKDPARLREILKTHRSILAVEMEVAGVYEAAQGIDHQYPVMAIRGISDIVGLQRDSRWTEYACQAAAAFTCAFIMTDPLDPPLNPASFQKPGAPSEIPSAQLRDSAEPGLIPLTEELPTKGYEYDVAISYASEDRNYADALAEALSRRGLNVFYAKYEKSTLWGKNLYSYLSDIYQQKAHYCVMFLSKHYATKLWTNHEREAAQARAFSENEEYILPVRLDDTKIPGIASTIAYLGWPPETAETIADAILEKLAEMPRLPPLTISHIPSTEVIVKALDTLSGHTDTVLSIAISPDGQTLVSGSNDETIKLWHLPDRQVLHTFEGHLGAVASIAISPDGKILASGGSDGRIKLWNLHNKKFLDILGNHTALVTSIAISPDGKILASGGSDGRIKLWNLPSKELLYVLAQQNLLGKLYKILVGHSVQVLSIAISPNGQILASSDTDSTIKLWNLQTRQQIGRLEGHSNIVNSIAISPDGQILASGSDDTTIILWNIANRQRLYKLEKHTEAVVSVAVSPNGQLLATGSTDKTIKIWNLHTAKLRCSLENSVPVWSVIFSPDGQIFASGGSDGTIKVWKYTLGEL